MSEEGKQLPKVEYRFGTSGATNAWRVRCFELQEALSTPFHGVVDLMSDEEDADTESLLGSSFQLDIVRESVRRHICGIVFRTENHGTASGHVLARVHVAPAVWALSFGKCSRIFQDKTAPEIIKTVLEEGLEPFHREFELRLTSNSGYPKREYCAQYRESDLAFLQRLMEEEGIAYFFEHQGEKEVMVLADANDQYPCLETSPVQVAAMGAAIGHTECVLDFDALRELGASKVVVRDYDWTRPALELKHEAQGASQVGPAREEYEHFPSAALSEYSEGELKYTKDFVESRARVALERALQRKSRITGSSNVAGMGAGQVFEIVGCAQAELDQKYLVTGLRHVGRAFETLAGKANLQADVNQSQDDYRNWFECVPASVPYRPSRTARRPVIFGLLTATVVGPASEEVYTDAHGRVRIQFQWDREGARDEKSSCWVRVAQAWAGPGWGTLFLPRIGMEVLVQFIEGDPDRPMIIGSVYNGSNPPPYLLPDEKTKSTIRTATSPGGGGFNELRFEDARDSEEVFLHAQKDLNAVVEHDMEVVVHNDEKRTVEKDQMTAVEGDLELSVGGNRRKSVEGDEATSVGGDRTATVTGSETVSIDGERSESIAGSMSLSVEKNVDEQVKGDRNVNVDKSETLSVGGSRKTNVAESDTLEVKKSLAISAEKQFQLQQGKTTVVLKEDRVEVKAGGAIKIVHEGASIQIDASGAVKIKTDKAAEVSAGGCSIKMSGGKLVLKGSKASIN